VNFLSENLIKLSHLSQINDTDVLIVTPDQSLIYSSAEYFKSAVIKKVATQYSSVQYVVINGASINHSVDVTVVKVSANRRYNCRS
jgi:solute carrier family 26 (sodium-independent sulfate anion transporter), member 11